MNNALPTATQISAAVAIVAALAEAIRTLGSVPAGDLYARVMDTVSLENFDASIKVLVGARLVREDGFTLVWIGPVIE